MAPVTWGLGWAPRTRKGHWGTTKTTHVKCGHDMPGQTCPRALEARGECGAWGRERGATSVLCGQSDTVLKSKRLFRKWKRRVYIKNVANCCLSICLWKPPCLL